MGKKKKQDAISTFIGSESEFLGTLSFDGTIRIDGRLKGEITSAEGTLIIGESAIIEADIKVGSGIIMGEVTGTVQAKDRIEVYKPPGLPETFRPPLFP